MTIRVLGDCSEGVPPVPIPNTEVKPFSPDGTACASVWESRKSPKLVQEGPVARPGLSCFLWEGITARWRVNSDAEGAEGTGDFGGVYLEARCQKLLSLSGASQLSLVEFTGAGRSPHRFRSNEVRLWLRVIAYNLGSLWRRLALPLRVGNGSLTSLQQRLVRRAGA
jgi:hypothetical protein